MSFFNDLLRSKNLPTHDGTKKLWEYFVTDKEFEGLEAYLRAFKDTRPPAKESALYYAEWWKRKYNGGTPSKEKVFEDLFKNQEGTKLDATMFFKQAERGAESLHIKWIKRQNTLYFRSILLQGGLPLYHISQNQGPYLNFISAVLELAPDSVLDFADRTEITNLLPPSARNQDIYENCFEIVQSLLNEEPTYDKLFSSNNLSDISTKLKVKAKNLQQRVRMSKPKVYWVLSVNEYGSWSVQLSLGFADSYSAANLANILGIEEAQQASYQLFLDNTLVCVFRKMLSGKYKTDWVFDGDLRWDNTDIIPQAYALIDGNKFEVTDLLPHSPSWEEPTLWTSIDETGWRLVQGKNIDHEKAMVVFPTGWTTDHDNSSSFSLNNQTLYQLEFEGEITFRSGDNAIRFQTGVESFDWLIKSQKPSWMIKANMPVVRNLPQIWVYDKENKRIAQDKYKLSYRLAVRSNASEWQPLSKNLPLGLIQLRIEKDGVVADDHFYNIGRMDLSRGESELRKATLLFSETADFTINIYETSILSVQTENDRYLLSLDPKNLQIPAIIEGSVKLGSQKSLRFHTGAPFSGIGLVNPNGELMPTGSTLSLNNLHGYRILSPANQQMTLKTYNKKRQDVKISREGDLQSRPLIGYKEELLRIFFLADAMDHENSIVLELKSGGTSVQYDIKGFTHTLDISALHEDKVQIHEPLAREIDLYAIPLNCNNPDDIELIPLVHDSGFYGVPQAGSPSKQFIIVSAYQPTQQLQPRFINIDGDYTGPNQETRIANYHQAFIETSFQHNAWRELLAYFKLCQEQHLPFSTFDQIRAISRSPEVAAKAFVWLGAHQENPDEYIQTTILELEEDLGFCFHWIDRLSWEQAINQIVDCLSDEYTPEVMKLLGQYFSSNNFDELFRSIGGGRLERVQVLKSDIQTARGQLGPRVLGELPHHAPHITQGYGISIDDDGPTKLLCKAPIAVAESISNRHEKSLWGGNDFTDTLRRNIQYIQYLSPNLYKNIILHVLTR